MGHWEGQMYYWKRICGGSNVLLGKAMSVTVGQELKVDSSFASSWLACIITSLACYSQVLYGDSTLAQLYHTFTSTPWQHSCCISNWSPSFLTYLCQPTPIFTHPSNVLLHPVFLHSHRIVLLHSFAKLCSSLSSSMWKRLTTNNYCICQHWAQVHPGIPPQGVLQIPLPLLHVFFTELNLIK